MAVRTRANYKTTKDLLITTNAQGDISGADMNAMLEDIADSALFPEDLPSVTPYRGRHDYSGGDFPETGGNGPGGVYAAGDFFVGTNGCSGTLKDENEDPIECVGRITAYALITDPGQLGANWKINQG